MIETLSGFPDGVVALACHGQVTRKDYETVLEPAVERALAGHQKVRLYYRIGEDFTGFDPGALWEDLKVGLGHLSRWDRIALVTDVAWIGQAVHALGFLLPAEVRIFPAAEAGQARAWLLG
ncbi:SpoIIAA-like [Tistlia consotensis]|uniref:SpoIIAA-like n=1 Tax=Tistlia consotensis USBA 355 TaxID=560819 RepID=A0A1Y6B826_9PROT|nr:STAS/SEC14 domain-containing protein [Tistlia consotensis]SME93533.1 SpoIIAA-like [Tistlia consotensis USBA 355]SNR28687.1 SpoIIAA-like [Tistlia consotensis]